MPKAKEDCGRIYNLTCFKSAGNRNVIYNKEDILQECGIVSKECCKFGHNKNVLTDKLKIKVAVSSSPRNDFSPLELFHRLFFRKFKIEILVVLCSRSVKIIYSRSSRI